MAGERRNIITSAAPASRVAGRSLDPSRARQLPEEPCGGKAGGGGRVPAPDSLQSGPEGGGREQGGLPVDGAVIPLGLDPQSQRHTRQRLIPPNERPHRPRNSEIEAVVTREAPPLISVLHCIPVSAAAVVAAAARCLAYQPKTQHKI
ncbi:hypothetical protein E2C01_065423 [Portunus trituberculatus]|uniref:Uncharacterized protein n=1 Tax=Portunus trituberculatus TaxID=210409 RepID=A0A5B7HLV4_PORTR|nr:hypothetical protein [Portunus trituberculatus]